MNASPPDLDALLSSLHLAGLPVGTRERVRLQHVFRLAPRLGGRGDSGDSAPDDELRDLLRAALVHDLNEGKIFDQVYGLWSERWQRWLTAGQAARQKIDPSEVDVPVTEGEPKLEKLTEDQPSRRLRRSGGRWAMLRVALLVVPLLWLQSSQKATQDLSPTDSNPTATPPPVSSSLATEVEALESNFATPLETVYYPHFEVVGELKGFGVDISRLWLGLFLMTLAGVLGTLAERKALPVEARPPPTLGGPPRLPLLPLPSHGPELLDPASLRALVWGVEKHVTEQESRHLDVPASAEASAEQGGMPTLCFEPEEALREVWLWIDTWASDDALVEVWAGDIAESLRRAGLPVRVGYFDGVPDALSWDDGGQVFQPRHVESQRQLAMVAILTDGAVLAAHIADERRGGVLELFGGLRSWPRLAVVDCSASAEPSVLDDLPVPCIKPMDLPAFFGLGRTTASAPPKADLGTLRAWKAALALGHRPPERGTAWTLARALKLDLASWEVHRLDEVASTESVEDLVRWLALDAYGGVSDGMRSGSLLDRALNFWRDRLQAEADRREVRRELDGWHDSRAERHLAVEMAVLDLWRKPVEASRRLQSLAGGEWSEVIRARVGRLAPRDGAGETLVPLPWCLHEVDDVVKQRLAGLGLGGVCQGTLQRSGRLVLGFSLLLTLAVVSLGQGFWVAQNQYLGVDEVNRLAFAAQDAAPEHALALFRLVLEGQEQIHGRRSVEVATALNNLGQILVRLGRPAEGSPLLEESYALQSELLGEYNARTLASLSNLAVLWDSLESADEAISTARLLLDRRLQVYGEKGLSVAKARNVLGYVLLRHYKSASQLEEAEDHLLHAINTLEATPVQSQQRFLVAFQRNLLAIQIELGKTDEALRLFGTLLPQAQSFWPEGHWRIADLTSLEGALRLAQGDRDAAEPLLKSGWEDLYGHLGEGAPYVVDARRRLEALRQD